jgi:hypothetical protein
MAEARQYYMGEGYEVRDTARTHPYDLRCRRGEEQLLVEVKGTQTDGGAVFLTANEVREAQSPDNRMALFVQHNVRVDRGADGEVQASGGDYFIVDPWKAEEAGLQPLTYRYEIGPRPS